MMAAQAAAAIMTERTKAFQAEEAKKLAPDPKFIDESTEQLGEMFSELQPEVPLSPPNAPERRGAIAPITSPVPADDHAAGEWQLRRRSHARVNTSAASSCAIASAMSKACGTPPANNSARCCSEAVCASAAATRPSAVSV
ncbi:Uncharacterised protein [Mycobacteroides abscessus subsp. bolletii]|nr:Uncharacterised protein [Mycobacteroides abscessus subsp. bolletii]